MRASGGPGTRHILHRQVFDSPVGALIALASPEGLCSLEFDDPRRASRLKARLDKWFAPYRIVDAESDALARAASSESPLRSTARWLAAYFAGAPGDSCAPRLDLRGTSFELRVWRALGDVPYGSTSTYGAIAARIGTPGGSRAVGLANGSNPTSLIVPCHRIVGSNGSLTGYGGGLDRKRWLLRHESAEATDLLF